MSDAPDEPPAAARRLALLALVVAGALARFLLSLPLKEQVLFADEAAPLLIARLLSGAGATPTMANDAFYHAGYPLLLAPFSGLEPLTFYRATLAVNAVLLACLVPLVYVLVRQWAPVNHRRALVIAVAASLYPTFLLHSTMTWTENAVVPVVVLTVVAFGAVVRRRDALAAAGYGGAAALAYLVHPRLLLLVGVALVAAALAWWKRLLDRRAIGVGVGVLAVGFVATRVLHAWVRSSLYLDGPAADEGEVISRLFRDPVNALRVLRSLAGQAWYLCAASYGLAALGAAVLVLLVVRRRNVVALQALATCAAMLAVSSLFVIDPSRVDQRVYGRYGEGFLVMLLGAGLLGLTSARRRWPHWWELACVAALPAALALATVLGYGGEAFSGVLNPFNVLGIEHVIIERGGLLEVGPITVVAVVGGLVLVLVRRVLPARTAPAVAAGLLALAFVASTLKTNDGWIGPIHQVHRGLRTLPGQLHDLEARTGLDIERLDARYRFGQHGGEFFGYQVLLPDVRFDPWLGKEPFPRGPWVLTTLEWPEGEAAGALRVLSEAEAADTALWVLPGPEQDRVRQSSTTLSR